MSRPKALVFYQYLPPWRIDVFNEMGKYYDMTIAFTNADCEGFTYNREELLGKLQNIKTIFLTKGMKIGKRPVRWGIFRLLNSEKPDIVFSHEYSPTSILIALYKQLRFFHYKYFLTTSDNVQMANSVSGLKARARSYILNQSNGIIVYSDAVKDWYKKHFGRLKIEICPNIQNPQSLLAYRKEFPQRHQRYKRQFNLENKNVILYTGRLVEVKGLDLLLNAFAKAQTGNYVLVIVGDGKQKNSLVEQTRTLKIQDKVVFAGFYSGIDLYAWYDLANFFILPSRYEPFGAVVNEALIYGCPVLASKYIGATDFITSKNGILFDPLDEQEFVDTLQCACSQYHIHTMNRSNLMPCSFDEYVYSFYKISQP